MMKLAPAVLCCAIIGLMAGVWLAQQSSLGGQLSPPPLDKTASPPATPPFPTQKGSPTPPQKVIGVPSPKVLMMLMRTTLVALNQANFTGNYTVLHDLGSPELQAKNSAAQLGIAFTALRNQHIDLSPVLVMPPQVTEAPAMTPEGVLRIAGYFPMKPRQISFVMLFQPVAGVWRLHGLSVTAASAATAADPGAAGGAQTPTKKESPQTQEERKAASDNKKADGKKP